MTSRRLDPKSADATALDLHHYSLTLTRLLSALLFSRDRDALRRWCAVRSWVDNALDGEESLDLLTLEIVVADLVDHAGDRWGQP